MIRTWMLLTLCLVSITTWAAPPKRVVALTWDSAEQLLELGITPIAVAGRTDYSFWGARPILPASVLDAGSRSEPNLERLAALKPDLILIDTTLADLQSRLARIAPTQVLNAFSAQHDNAAAARTSYLRLAHLFERDTYAQARLQALDARMTALRRQLHQRYPQQAPAVCVMRVSNASLFWFYGNNSMPQAALQALGLRPGCPAMNSAWGAVPASVDNLAALGDIHVLAIAPLGTSKAFSHSSLWQSMPFVRAGHFTTIRPVWTNGGVFSLQDLAEEITQAMMRAS